jgi:hypothetical protein
VVLAEEGGAPNSRTARARPEPRPKDDAARGQDGLVVRGRKRALVPNVIAARVSRAVDLVAATDARAPRPGRMLSTSSAQRTRRMVERF